MSVQTQTYFHHHTSVDIRTPHLSGSWNWQNTWAGQCVQKQLVTDSDSMLWLIMVKLEKFDENNVDNVLKLSLDCGQWHDKRPYSMKILWSAQNVANQITEMMMYLDQNC